MKQQRKKKAFIDVQTENESDNLVVFLTNTTLPLQAETWLIKVQKLINKNISQGSKKVEHIFPKILRGAIEDVYQMPLRLLGIFAKQQFNKIKRKMYR